MTGRIGISVGDITGIGPEVTLKALATFTAEERSEFLLIGDWEHLHQLDHALRLDLRFIRHPEKKADGHVAILSPEGVVLPPNLKAGDAHAAKAAVAWLEAGARLCLSSELDAMVTAPVNKESIIRAGIKFVGQTEYLSEIAGTDRTVMMLLGHDDRGRWLRVALVTTHLPLKRVPENINPGRILLAIERAAEACRLLGLDKARVGVCGLNPHAGEGGKMGNEELTTIAPTVASARAKGLDAAGPLPADTLFHQAFRGDFDVVVAMYHDQGLGPLKMIGFDSGVNWTLGLPFIRTSPDHGTAYDLAGKHSANPSSMIAAIRLAQKLSACPPAEFRVFT